MSTDGIWGNVLKIKPPMVFSVPDADELLRVLRFACQELSQSNDVDASEFTLLHPFAEGRKSASQYFAALSRETNSFQD
jgi:hypothetical protein